MPTGFARHLIGSIAVVLLSLALSACASGAPEAGGETKARRPPLRIGHSNWTGYFPLSIAQEKGFFAQQGVEVELVVNPDPYSMILDFSAGKADGMPWTMEVVVRILAKEPDVRVVLNSGQTAGADVIVARPEIETIADLRGKTIAAKAGATGEMLVTEMLQRSGLGIDDVTLVDVSEQDLVAHLQDGVIQAGHTWQPYAAQAMRNGARVLFSTKETPGLFADFTLFRGSILREQPDDVRAFIRAWFQAVEYWQAHPEEGNEIIGRAMNIPPGDISTEGYEFFSLADVQRRFAPGNDPSSLIPLVNKHVEFLVQDGQLGRRPDVHAIFDSSFLPPAGARP